MANDILPVYFRNEYKFVDKLNHWDPKNKRITNILSLAIFIILVIPAFFYTVFILVSSSYSTYLGILFLFLMIPVVFLHELIHFTFQWLFGKQRPQLGFKFPYPYSKLRSSSSISRNQGITTALAPFFLITLTFMITALFVNPVMTAALILLTTLNASICGGDFHCSYWLFSSSKDTRVCVVEFDTVLFQRENST